MKGNTRAARLYKLGLEEAPSANESTKAVLRAVAVMVAEATKPASVKRAEERSKLPDLPFTPAELYEAVLNNAGDTVACEPYNSRWFGQLGKTLHSMMPQLQRSDVEVLCSWLAQGGVSWMRDKPSFGTLVKKLPEWLPKAREWNRSSKTETEGSFV